MSFLQLNTNNGIYNWFVIWHTRAHTLTHTRAYIHTYTQNIKGFVHFIGKNRVWSNWLKLKYVAIYVILIKSVKTPKIRNIRDAMVYSVRNWSIKNAFLNT